MKKIKKYIEFFITKINVLYKQKNFKYDGNTIKYMFDKNDSDVLIVIFSACTRKGLKARYNYYRTLKKINVNKLFILDDFGTDKRGSYYLGKNGNNDIPNGVNKLIDKIQKENYISNSIFVGTSKGGTAALYFGMQRDTTIIIGAPAYKLGNYMNIEDNQHMFKFIMKEINNENIKYLNELVLSEIVNNKGRSEVYIQYSKKEIFYEDHIKYLIKDLENNNIKYHINEKDYVNHSDISLYFPKYLIETLKELI